MQTCQFSIWKNEDLEIRQKSQNLLAIPIKSQKNLNNFSVDYQP